MSGHELVRIESIGAGGAGVGRREDGRVVFVHRTAPGDQVEIEVTSERRSWSRGRLMRVLAPGEGRRVAPCPFYDRCGGCSLEHLEYRYQLEAKAGIVGDAIARIGGIDARPAEVVASPDEFRYRNRVSFTLLRLGAGRTVAGFHELERPGRIVDVDGRCMLPEPAISAAWDELREGWGEGARRLPSGRELRLTLRSTSAGSVTLLVEGGFARGRPDELLEAVPELRSIWHRTRAGAPTLLLAGEPSVVEEWGGHELAVAGEAFLQVNRRAARLLEEHVLTLPGEVSGARVVDAYCGIGIYGRELAGRGARVTGIESSAEAVTQARRLAVGEELYIEGLVEEHLAETLPADVVIMNPPRGGLHARVIDVLKERAPRQAVYVSCDPATLARDLKRLSDAFALRSIRCFDLFPQTSGVETVVELVREEVEG